MPADRPSLPPTSNNGYLPAAYSTLTSATEHTSKLLSDAKQTATKTLIQTYDKVDDLRIRYLTVEYLTLKAGHAVKAKVLPLSNPPGWDDKMKKAKKQVTILKILKASRGKLLNDVKIQLSKASKAAIKNTLQETEVQLTEQYNKLCDNLEVAKKQVDYLEKQRFSQISSRFAGYVGMATNFIVPGSGTLIGVALTGVSAATQEKLVDLLPEDKQVKSEEKRNVRYGTFSTVACTVASVAFSIFAMPMIKDAAWSLLESNSNSPSVT